MLLVLLVLQVLVVLVVVVVLALARLRPRLWLVFGARVCRVLCCGWFFKQ